MYDNVMIKDRIPGAVCGCGRAGDKTGCSRRPEGGIGYVLPVPLLKY